MKTEVKEKLNAFHREEHWSKKTHMFEHEHVALRAYQIWQEHGCTHGQDVEDWLQAEQELNDHCQCCV